MTISGILSSPSQRRVFLFISLLLLAGSIVSVLLIALLAPATPVWNDLRSFLISIVASGVFALTSGLYLTYMFNDPNDLATKFAVLPQDIRKALEEIASNAPNYRIYVRTGRHFRSEILPILIKHARQSQSRMRIEVILLDLRHEELCDRYARFRANSSFDRSLWDLAYVRTEVLSTILALIHASKDNADLLEIGLFLSTRLSAFRIEGSANELLVTREDPKDNAMRYRRSDRDYSAFAMELDWICAEAFQVKKFKHGVLPSTVASIFDDEEILRLESIATARLENPSPYVR